MNGRTFPRAAMALRCSTTGKYGISVRDSDMRLTLHKGGCRPDPTGDVGQHEMLYALLPHLGPMGAENVIAPARELNYPALYTPGTALFVRIAGNGFAPATF